MFQYQNDSFRFVLSKLWSKKEQNSFNQRFFKQWEKIIEKKTFLSTQKRAFSLFAHKRDRTFFLTEINVKLNLKKNKTLIFPDQNKKETVWSQKS